MSRWNHQLDHHQFSTPCIRGGVEADPCHGAILPPLYQTTTFRKRQVGEDQTFSYSRVENPTVAVLESRLGDLEQCLPAVCFSTGMSAVTTLFLALLKAGDHVVCSDVVYGGTYRLFKEVLENLGVASSFVDTADPRAIAAALRPETRVLLLENAGQSHPQESPTSRRVAGWRGRPGCCRWWTTPS